MSAKKASERDAAKSSHPRTQDGRYLVVRGRLWRLSNPALDPTTRQLWVDKLMAARRAIKQATGDPIRIAEARRAVHQAKIGLGERGPVWWQDGSPDFNRRMVVDTPYADWFATLPFPSAME